MLEDRDWTPPTVNELRDYDEYLDSLPKHGASPQCDGDQDDRSDELWDDQASAPEGFKADPCSGSCYSEFEEGRPCTRHGQPAPR